MQKKNLNSARMQKNSIIVLLQFLATLYMPLYFLIIQPNSGIWTIFILLAMMVAISWGSLLVPILFVVMISMILKFSLAYIIFLISIVFPVYFSLRYFSQEKNHFLITLFILFIIGILIYVVIFIAYLNGVSLSNFKK